MTDKPKDHIIEIPVALHQAIIGSNMLALQLHGVRPTAANFICIMAVTIGYFLTTECNNVGEDGAPSLEKSWDLLREAYNQGASLGASQGEVKH